MSFIEIFVYGGIINERKTLFRVPIQEITNWLECSTDEVFDRLTEINGWHIENTNDVDETDRRCVKYRQLVDDLLDKWVKEYQVPLQVQIDRQVIGRLIVNDIFI